MKFRHLLLSLLAVAAFSATSCQEEEKDLGLPEIKISQNELALDQGVGSTNLNVYATRNWTVSTTADWIAVNPSKGAAYSETKVTVTVLENEGYNRTGTVKFDIGYDSKTLTINQTGAQGEKSEGAGTAEDPYTVAGVLAFLETLGTTESENVVYVKGKVTAITEAFSAQYGNGTFTITDDGNGSSTPFTAYRVLYLGNKKWTASNPALAEGDDVIVAGKVINYNGKTPETVQGTGYVYSHNGNTAGGGGSGDAGDPEGDGTEANPYNIAGIIQYTSSLAADATSDKDVYFKGVVTSVGTIDTGYGNGTFYVGTTKESETTFYCFRALYLGNTKFTSTDQLKAGDEVVMCGKVTNYKGNTPETVASKAYIYKLNGETGGGGGGGDDTDAIFSETFETSQGNFTIDNKSLGGIEKVWALDATYKCMKATGYANSTNYATESWLVSPEIDLTSQTTAFLTFDHAGKYFSSVDKAKEETTLRISADGGNTWEAVVIPTYYALDFKFVSSGEISLASYVGKKIKIAFRYTSTTEKAGTWEVKNVKVYKTSTGGGTGGGGDTSETFLSETFETSQGNFTIDNKSLGGIEKVWAQDATYKCMKATGYANSTNYATESWLVSPEVDLTSTTTAYLSFEHAGKYFTDVDKAKAETTLKVSPDGGTTWEAVAIPTYYALDFKFVASGEIDLAKYAGKKIKIAFVYTSTTEKAGTWEVKNVKIYKTSAGGNTGGGGGGDTGNGNTINLNSSLSWADQSDATYGAGASATSNGFTVGAYKHTGGTAISTTSGTFLQSDHIRVFKNSVFAITAPSGKKIKSLKITPSAASYLIDMTVLEGAGTFTKGTATLDWAGDASKVVFHMTEGQVRMSKVEVVVE